MKLSLRLRLALLAALTLALGMGMVLYLTWYMGSRTMVEMEEKSFTSLLVEEEQSLNLAFISQLADRVWAVKTCKSQLKETALQTRSLLGQLYAVSLHAAERQRLIETALLRSRSGGECVYLLRPHDMRPENMRRLGLLPEEKDIKQQSLYQILQNLPEAGQFTVLDLPRRLTVPTDMKKTAQEKIPTLLFLLPCSVRGAETDLDDHVLVTVISLESLEIQTATATALLLEAVRRKFNSIPLYSGGFMALLDAQGHALAQRGEQDIPLTLLPLTEARRDGRATAVIPSPHGEILCLVSHNSAFGWYTVMAAPLAEIRAPSDQMLTRLLWLTAALTLLTALGALLLLMRSLRPLEVLTRKSDQLAQVDLGSPDALARLEPLMAQGLPLERRDEIGHLARAFAGMGKALAKNIRTLMEATANKERLEGEMSAARDIQMGILPPSEGAETICGFPTAALLVPAREVGGDLYDFFVTHDGRHCLIIGDVSGKGAPAALFMAMTITLLRYAMDSGLNPAQAMSKINALLAERNSNNMFVSLFVAQYEPHTGRLAYANGGHCPPYVVNAEGQSALRVLGRLSGPLVGVMPDLTYELFVEHLAEGDTCLLFTDGVTEAMNGQKDLYGEERLMSLLSRYRTEKPHALLAHIFADIEGYRGNEPQSDDITMLAFHREKAS
ncbi:MAG: SpoIIE family protein phosphatase [Desulfovibrio sp.]|nr:SpoIIE family protein phosphatase [Desulfovibrio sp.]